MSAFEVTVCGVLVQGFGLGLQNRPASPPFFMGAKAILQGQAAQRAAPSEPKARNA